MRILITLQIPTPSDVKLEYTYFGGVVEVPTLFPGMSIEIHAGKKGFKITLPTDPGKFVVATHQKLDRGWDLYIDGEIQLVVPQDEFDQFVKDDKWDWNS
tara:strand:- start:4901 stop:5200 length:300 start_codon:yes stop_codon:yes gene_type:complete